MKSGPPDHPMRPVSSRQYERFACRPSIPTYLGRCRHSPPPAARAHQTPNRPIMPSIAIVCTSSPTLGGHKTGLWLEECASPYYTFHEAGYEVILASPLGGPVPLDAASLGADFLTEPAKKFLLDPDAMGSLSHTTKLADVDTSALDAIFFCGGHGTCAAGDFVDNASVKAAVEGMYSKWISMRSATRIAWHC